MRYNQYTVTCIRTQFNTLLQLLASKLENWLPLRWSRIGHLLRGYPLVHAFLICKLRFNRFFSFLIEKISLQESKANLSALSRPTKEVAISYLVNKLNDNESNGIFNTTHVNSMSDIVNYYQGCEVQIVYFKWGECQSLYPHRYGGEYECFQSQYLGVWMGHGHPNVIIFSSVKRLTLYVFTYLSSLCKKRG